MPMNKTDKFGQAGAKGSLGEQKIMEYYNRIGYDVDDLTADTTGSFEYESRGIDFRIKKSSWKNWMYCDSKANLSGNTTFLEVTKDGKPGWFCSSQSNRIKHYDVVSQRMAYYDLPEMRLEVIKQGLIPDARGLIKIDINDFPNIRVIAIK